MQRKPSHAEPKNVKPPTHYRGSVLSACVSQASAPGPTHHADHGNINLVGFLLLLVGQHRVQRS